MQQPFYKLPPILEEPGEGKEEWLSVYSSTPEWTNSPASTKSDLTSEFNLSRSDISSEATPSALNSAIQDQYSDGVCIYCGSLAQGVDWGLDMCHDCTEALEHDLPRQRKINCAQCDLSIEGHYVEALGTVWHPSCFSCLRCGTHVQHGFIIDGHLFCSICHSENARCGLCASPVVGLCLSSPTARYHPYHFSCQTCQEPLPSTGFSAINGKIQCSDCAEGTLVPFCLELPL
ncbi:hypothetical protein DSO57_1016697 [Entomophthora muscae]|uniref:Uncharacterized protein n=1 Tax=Entomophthora muscae TaxID=34485 RepID=A0ACC2S6U3_9FUNG|nr:hypothetical protein DSO57_1016697 [Entomophthora muscae]